MSEALEPEHPAEIAKRLISASRYMTLSTADASGRPWASPVFFAGHGFTELLWVSAPDTVHSCNIAERPEISIVVFDTDAAIGQAQALYMRAEAGRVGEEDLDRLIAAYSVVSERWGAGPWGRDDVLGDARLRLYRAIGTEFSVLDAISRGQGGDRRVPLDRADLAGD